MKTRTDKNTSAAWQRSDRIWASGLDALSKLVLTCVLENDRAAHGHDLYPSIERIAWQTSLAYSTARKAVGRLEACGVLSRIGVVPSRYAPRGRVARYQFDETKLPGRPAWRTPTADNCREAAPVDVDNRRDAAPVEANNRRITAPVAARQVPADSATGAVIETTGAVIDADRCRRERDRCREPAAIVQVIVQVIVKCLIDQVIEVHKCRPLRVHVLRKRRIRKRIRKPRPRLPSLRGCRMSKRAHFGKRARKT